MRSFDELLAEAESASTTGWGFGWLDGRASEERPPWGYARMMALRLADARSALDVDTGGGEVLDEAEILPSIMMATESWHPNVLRAHTRLAGRGVQVVEVSETTGLPFRDASFELVTSRHPVAPNWEEIYRVLQPGGYYFAQHVGPASAFELIEYFLGPLPIERQKRDPEQEVKRAEAAGLTVTDLRTARCRMVFHDVGAVVWILRKCIWWVPNFSVSRYIHLLRRMDSDMRQGYPFVAHSTRHLIEARR